MVNKKLHATLTPEQLGALAGNGLVRVQAGRRTVELHVDGSDSDVWTQIATDNDGNEYDVVVMPDNAFESILDVCDMDTDKDRVKINRMILLRESEADGMGGE